MDLSGLSFKTLAFVLGSKQCGTVLNSAFTSTMCSQWIMSKIAFFRCLSGFKIMKMLTLVVNTTTPPENSVENWAPFRISCSETGWGGGNPTKLHNLFKPLHGNFVFSFFSLSPTCTLLCWSDIENTHFRTITEQLLWYHKDSSWIVLRFATLSTKLPYGWHMQHLVWMNITWDYLLLNTCLNEVCAIFESTAVWPLYRRPLL